LKENIKIRKRIENCNDSQEKKNLRDSQNKGNEKKKDDIIIRKLTFCSKKKREVYLVFFKDYLYFYILKLVSSRTNIRNRVQKYIEIIG